MLEPRGAMIAGERGVDRGSRKLGMFFFLAIAAYTTHDVDVSLCTAFGVGTVVVVAAAVAAAATELAMDGVLPRRQQRWVPLVSVPPLSLLWCGCSDLLTVARARNLWLPTHVSRARFVATQSCTVCRCMHHLYAVTKVQPWPRQWYSLPVGDVDCAVPPSAPSLQEPCGSCWCVAQWMANDLGHAVA